MNDSFLLADCVFDFLTNSNFIYPSKWKRDTTELYYTVSFHKKETRCSTISFQVTVSDGVHKVTKSIIRCLEKRFSTSFATVFTDCVI
jgi:hypothetical protein